MSVVNSEGLTLFGAGSEWFWSMLQFVVVAITLVGIYVQLRQARAANAFAQANAMKQEWEGEPLQRRRLAIWNALRDRGPDTDLSTLAIPIGNFWDNIGGLVRAGHVELAVACEFLGGASPGGGAFSSPPFAPRRPSLDVASTRTSSGSPPRVTAT